MPASYPTPSDPLSAGHIDSGATTEAHSRMHGRVLDVWENVQAYGAIGDGIVDDTLAIQACIDACSAAGGGVVYLPPGTYKVSQSAQNVGWCILLKSGVQMTGTGWDTCIIKAAGSLPAAVNYVVGNTGNVAGLGYSNFQINGNIANQGHSVGALNINKDSGAPFIGSYGSGSVGGDVLHVDHMLFMDCTGPGLQFTQTSAECKVTNSTAFNVSIGFDLRADTFLSMCTAGLCTAQAYIGRGSCRFVGCKAYATGAGVAAWELHANSNEVAGCEVQECLGNGFLINGSSNIVQASVEDINGSVVVFGAGSGYAVTGCKIDIVYNDSTGVGSGNYAATHYIDNTIGTAVLNDVKIMGESGGSSGPTGTVFAGRTEANKFQYAIQGDAMFIGTYAASFNPAPGVGNYFLTLTGNITINAPVADAAVGSKLGFLFLEDGVGGRTISFNTIFKTNWTPATTANDKNWIEFVYDGTHWLQTSATTVAL